MDRLAALLALSLAAACAAAPLPGVTAASASPAFVVDEFGYEPDAVHSRPPGDIPKTAPAPGPRKAPDSPAMSRQAKGTLMIVGGIATGLIGAVVLAGSSIPECEEQGFSVGPCGSEPPSVAGQTLGGAGLLGGMVLFIGGIFTASTEPGSHPIRAAE